MRTIFLTSEEKTSQRLLLATKGFAHKLTVTTSYCVKRV